MPGASDVGPAAAAAFARPPSERSGPFAAYDSRLGSAGMAAPGGLSLQQQPQHNGYRPARVSVPPSSGALAGVLESPVLLPVLPTEPSPTTGIPFPLPLFRGTPRSINVRTCGSNATPEASRDGAGGGPSPEGRKRRESQANVDGYQWKKYGEKNLKCSDTPRSYYKCSVAGCSAKKYVEYDPVTGQIAQTVIKGEHTHGKAYFAESPDNSPHLSRHQRKPTGNGSGVPSPDSCNGLLSIMEAAKLASDRLSNNKDGVTKSEDSDDARAPGPVAAHHNAWPHRALGPRPGLVSMPTDAGGCSHSSMDTDHEAPQRSQRSVRAGSGDSASGGRQKASGSGGEGSVGVPTTQAVAADIDMDEGGSGGGEEEDERKVMFHDTDAENVEDGFKWRKYGRKQVKNSSFPRNYYRCTTEGCPVKKHVERYSSDPRKLMVCYEYLPHTHNPPSDLLNPNRPQRRTSLNLQEASRAGGIISTRRQAAESAKRRPSPTSGGGAGSERQPLLPPPALRQHPAIPLHNPCSQPLPHSMSLASGAGLGAAGDYPAPNLLPGSMPHSRSMGLLSPQRIDLLASVVAQQEQLDQVGVNGCM